MEQTNRTILFDKINPDKRDILTYIQDEMKESIEDSTLSEINQYLEVSSFEECVAKLQPMLYLCLDEQSRGVSCTSSGAKVKAIQEESTCKVYEIKFDNNYPLLKYYINMLCEKETELQDIGTQIVKLMFPFQDEKIFRRDYTNILSLYIAGKIEEATKEIHRFVKKYQNSFMLLYMIIHLACEELESLEQSPTESKIVVSSQLNKQIILSKISDSFLYRQIRIPEEKMKHYQQWLEENLCNIDNQILFKQLFSIGVYGTNYEEYELMKLYYETLDYYICIIETYWKHCHPLLEKLLGIYSYFAQYQVRKKGMSPKLVIANVTPEDILNIKNKEKLRLFLNSTNGKIYGDNVIWYAMIPHVEYVDKEKNGKIRERFHGNDKEIINFAYDLQDVKSLVQFLTEFKIQSFVSPISSQRTNAQWVLQHGVKEWISYQEKFLNKDYAEYLYPCFPNFSLSHSPYLELELDIKKSWNDMRVEKKGRQHLWIKEIAIEASYVAAGIYAAIQCPMFLEQHFPNKINKKIPGIGFRILKNEANKKLSSFLKANIFLFPQEVLEDVERKCCGVFFSPYGNRILVVEDSAMSKMYGEKNNISTVQTLTYMKRKLRYETQDYKAELIEAFFRKRPGSLMYKWNQNKEFYNSILKKDETILYQLDMENKVCTVEVAFEETKCRRTISLNE